MSRPRFKVLSRVKYAAGTSVKPHALPRFNHTNGMQPARAEILSAGHCELEGQRLEFQDVRLFFPVEQQ